jgi:hypothetical protein
MAGTSWWAQKVRQFRTHLGASVTSAERASIEAWTTAEQQRLFDSMHIADRRHGLDVVATLRAEGTDDHDLLLAGLLHDAGKGQVGVWPRVAYALGQAYGSWIWAVAGRLPGWGTVMARLQDHAELSARLAEAAGCPARTVELIRHQDAPIDPEAGRLLRLADEAN